MAISEENKAQYYLAKFEALSNAAEMIRGQRETLFAFEDERFDAVYKKEADKLASQLNKRAEGIYKFSLEVADQPKKAIDLYI